MTRDANRGWLIATILLMVVNLGILLLNSVHLAAAQRPREYRVVEVLASTERMQAALTEHANAGWKFVAIGMGEMSPPRLIFVRD